MRRRQRATQFFVLFLAVVVATLPLTAEAFVEDFDGCEDVLACHRCSSTDKDQIRECSLTGKIRTMTCPIDSETATDDADNSGTEYISCDRTQEDEHSLFVRFQFFCLLLGIFSYVWVRRYRSLFATLFDQRKVSSTRRPSDADNMAGGIEMASREEVAPLTGNSNLEIV